MGYDGLSCRLRLEPGWPSKLSSKPWFLFILYGLGLGLNNNWVQSTGNLGCFRAGLELVWVTFG
jgi:hypothetical protein